MFGLIAGSDIQRIPSAGTQYCVVEMFDCFKVSLSESFQRGSGWPTVLVPIVSSPNNNCFGIRSSDMRAT